MQSLHTSQVAHQAGAYPGHRSVFSVKRLAVFLLRTPGWDASPSLGYPGLYHHVPSFYHDTEVTT